MTGPASDRQIVQIRMSGGTLLIGPTQHPDIAFWQKALRQDQLHPLAGHGLRQAERACHAGPELRLLLDRLGVSTRSMSDTEVGDAVQRAIHDKRLSAVFLPASVKSEPIPLQVIVQPPSRVVLAPPDVWRMTPEARVEEMNRRTVKLLPDAIRTAFKGAFTKKSAAISGISLAALAAINMVPIAGEVVDGLLVGFAFASAGLGGLRALILLARSQQAAETARTEKELDAAAQQRCDAITTLGETFLAAMIAWVLRRGGGGRAKTESEPPPSGPAPQPRTPGEIGAAGEASVRKTYDIGAKTQINVNGRDRVPDGLTLDKLSEVKNVERLSYTQQLKDYSEFAHQTGREFDLYVRPDTKLSKPLQEAIQNGDINLNVIPPN